MKLSSKSIRSALWMPCLFSVLQLVMSCSNDDATIPTTPDSEEPEKPIEPETVEDETLPSFFINSGTNTIVDEPKVSATMTIMENGEESYVGNIGIEFRGASSQNFPKKSFGVETWDENNEDLDVSLLGFSEEEDWILYGPYADKSLMRNVLIYDLAREMGRYASRTRFVELTLNDEYQGVYVFMEKLKRDDGRIDISNLKVDENSGEDLTGGYILKIDKTAGTNVGDGYNELNSFASAIPPTGSTAGQVINFLYEEPDAQDITEEQKNYISSYVSNFENALASDDFTDPEIGYEAFIDTDSFIDFFLLTELSNNVDGYRLSTYVVKDKNEKLSMGPVWDFNLAFGNADYCAGERTDVWGYLHNGRCSEGFFQLPFWWGRLLQDPNYVLRVQARWAELRGTVLSEAAISGKIDNYASALNENDAANSNFEKWPILSVDISPNAFIGQTYEDETQYLKEWISARLVWLDGAITAL